MSEPSKWREWASLRGRYRVQATVSDLIAVALGVGIGWLMWGI